MPRLFTAIDPPPAVVDTLRTFCAAASVPFDARWTPPEQYHLTLRFIGHVDAEQARALEAALEQIDCPAFDIVPAGPLGVLPARRTPRVLTVSLDPTSPLRTLYDAVQDVLASHDVPRATRSFRPHITLARIKNGTPEAVHAFLQETEPPPIDPFPADRFTLYESELTPEGALHTPRAQYPLTPTPAS